MAARLGDVECFTSLEDVLGLDSVDAVAIATPARTHQAITLSALRAGKHVLVEKPLADSGTSASQMVELAEDNDLVLMTDHTYCYTPVVAKIREIIADGSLGDVLFIDSVRINLGLVQPDVDVFWDLAPHDLAIFDFILPGGLRPTGVTAHGADPLGAGRSCVGYLTLPLPGGAMAHVHVNWLSPTKIRQMVVGGTRRTLVWDDLNPQQRLSVYDRGVDLVHQSSAGADRTAATVSYRLGDTWAPALPEHEALGQMVTEFAASIREGRRPHRRTGGAAGPRGPRGGQGESRERWADGPDRHAARAAGGDGMTALGGRTSWSRVAPGRSARPWSTSSSRRTPHGCRCSTTWSGGAGRASPTPSPRDEPTSWRGTCATVTWSTT